MSHSMVLLELLQASVFPSSIFLLSIALRLFLRCRTSLSPQCHAVKATTIPNSTKLYVFRNFLLNSIASTIFLNLGSLPGSSGSTSLPPPAVVRTSQGSSVDAVA